MPISFQCPACGRNLEAPDAAAGVTGSCKFCQAKVTAPMAGGQAATMPPPSAQPTSSPLLAPPAPPPPMGGYGTGPGTGAGSQVSPGPAGYAPPPRAAVAYGQPNYILISLMWLLTVAFWGSRFLGLPIAAILWFPNLGAIMIAGMLRRSGSNADRLNGNARWIFGLAMVVLSLSLNWGFGM